MASAITKLWIFGAGRGDQIAKAMMDQLGQENVINREGKEVTRVSSMLFI